MKLDMFRRKGGYPLQHVALLSSVVLSSTVVGCLASNAYAQPDFQAGVLISWAQGEQGYLNEILFESQGQQGNRLNGMLEQEQGAPLANPTSPNDFAAIAHWQAQRKNFQAAAIAFQKAINLEPNNAKFYYGLGYSLAHLGNNAGAEKAYRQATFFAPDQVENYLGLGAVLTRQQAYEQATLVYITALSLQPDNATIFEALGALYVRQGYYNRAVEMLEQAVRLDPNRATAQSLLSVALNHTDKPSSYTKTLQTSASSRLKNSSSFVDIADRLSQADERSLALQLFQWTEEFEPNVPGLQEKMGNLWMKQQNYVMAASAYRQWTRTEPKNPEAYYSLGIALYQMGQLEEAITSLEKASSLYEQLLTSEK